MFKKLNFSLLVLLQALIISILCLSSSAYSTQEFYPFLAEVISDNVNIRAGQSKNFESLYKVKAKDELIVLDKVYSWYKVELSQDAKSFISDEFVLLTKEGKGIITANRLNIRSGPGSHYTVLGQLREGEEVFIINNKDGWLQIKPVKNTYGWILDDYVSFKSKNVEAYRKKHDLSNIKKVVKLGKKVIAKKKVEASENNPEKKKIVVPDLRKKIDEALYGKSKKNIETKRIISAKESSSKREGQLNKTVKIQVEKKDVIDKTAEVWKVFNKLKKSKKKGVQYLSAKGFIKVQNDIESKDIKYKFLIDGKTAFYIKGFKHILEEFLNFQVSMEGVVITEKQIKPTYPIVEIHKIQLVL